MRVYTVQPGETTAASVAAKDENAGCPKCGWALVEANPQRASIRRANGYLDFVDPLVPGESLWLPDAWFDGTLDRKPRSYFDALPSHTGLGQLPPDSHPHVETIMNHQQQPATPPPAYALAVRPQFGVSGCGGSVPYGQPLGPYGISYGLADAAPAPPAVGGFGAMLAKLPSSWPYWGLAAGGVLAITGIIMMASKK